MKIRNAILFLFVAAVAFASCKESEDNPVTTMNPTTEKILAEGLNIGAYGKDTTVLFPKADGYKIDIDSIKLLLLPKALSSYIQQQF